MAESTDCVTATDASEASDLDLVRRAQAGDTEAFGELVERNRRAVFRAALAALGSPAEADDVAQEAFVTAFRKLGGFRGESAFRTWMLAITWRKAIDRRTSMTRWIRQTVTQVDFGEDAPDIMETMPSRSRSQEDELASAQLHRTLRRLIGTLPKKLRDALLLAGSGEYSYEQIGEMLGSPVGTVKWRVSEARKMLKQKLTALGYTSSAAGAIAARTRRRLRHPRRSLYRHNRPRRSKSAPSPRLQRLYPSRPRSRHSDATGRGSSFPPRASSPRRVLQIPRRRRLLRSRIRRLRLPVQSC
jgi:RNA polymerase sigma-70 factor (ECF subfamily)